MRSFYCKIALLLLSLLLVGFEWEGRLARLRKELHEGDAAQRREVVRLLASYPASAVRDVLLEALGDRDAGVRAEAADAVGRVRLREAVPRLLDWLDDPDADVRTSAAVALGRIGATRAVPPLVRLLGDSHADVRKAAVSALESIGTGDVIVPLLGRLDDTDTSVKVAAARALGHLGDPQAVVPLVGRLRDDAPEVREAVYAALGELRTSRGIPGLMQGLSDAAPEARLTAIAALGRVGAREAVPSLVTLSTDPDTRVARAAVASLGSIGTNAAIAAVVSALARIETRGTAASVLTQIVRQHHATATAARLAGASSGTKPAAGEDPVVERLAEALDRETADGPVTAICRLLVRLAGITSIQPTASALLRALDDGRGSRHAVMEALGATGDSDALVPLLERLRSDDPAVQRAALDGLSALFERMPPDGRAADPLLAALGSVPADARPAVVQLLGRVHAARAVPTLRDLLDAKDPHLRLAAVEAIGTIGDPRGANALLPLLSDRDPRTRFEAAEALAGASTGATVQALLGLLTSPQPRDRHAVLLALAGALAHLRSHGTVPADLEARVVAAVGPILHGPDLPLAARAVDTLGRWAAPEAGRLLASVVQSGPPALRRQALRTLGEVEGHRPLELLRRTVDSASDPAARAAAAAALGEHGTAGDVPRLLKAIREGRWPVPAAAAFALERIVRRGRAGKALDPKALCDLAAHTVDPYVRANVAATFAALGGFRCPDGPDPLDWLGSRHAPAVRAAAARWLAAQSAHGHADADRAERALDACALSDPSPEVATVCGDPGQPPLTGTADVYAYNAGGSHLLTNRPVALRLADGSVLVTYSDLNGHVHLAHAPTGALVLEDPVSTPLEH